MPKNIIKEILNKLQLKIPRFMENEIKSTLSIEEYLQKLPSVNTFNLLIETFIFKYKPNLDLINYYNKNMWNERDRIRDISTNTIKNVNLNNKNIFILIKNNHRAISSYNYSILKYLETHWNTAFLMNIIRSLLLNELEKSKYDQSTIYLYLDFINNPAQYHNLLLIIQKIIILIFEQIRRDNNYYMYVINNNEYLIDEIYTIFKSYFQQIIIKHKNLTT